MTSERLHVNKHVNALLLSDDAAFLRMVLSSHDWAADHVTIVKASDLAQAQHAIEILHFNVLLLDASTRAFDVFEILKPVYEIDARMCAAAFLDTPDFALVRKCCRFQVTDIRLKAEMSARAVREVLNALRDQYCLSLQYTRLPPMGFQSDIMHQELTNGTFITGVSNEVPRWLEKVDAYRLVLLNYAYSYPADIMDGVYQDDRITLYVRILHDILTGIGGTMLMYVGGSQACICFYRLSGMPYACDVESTMRFVVSSLLIRYHTRSVWLASDEHELPRQIPAIYGRMRAALSNMDTMTALRANLYWTLDDETQLHTAVRARNSDLIASFFERKVQEITYEDNYEKAADLFVTGLLIYANKLYTKYDMEDADGILSRDGLDLYDTQALYEWCVSIFTCLIDSLQERETVHADKLSPFVRNALAYIARNSSDNAMRLTDVASNCRVSFAYLSRTFKREVGYGFNSYLNQLRVYRSLPMVRDGKESLQQVSETVGFNNYNIYFAYFKKMIGIAPTDYRSKPFDMEIDEIFQF